MRIDKHNTYLFSIDNKYGIIKRNYREIFKGDFTIGLTIAPDYEAIKSKLSSENRYYSGFAIGATGMHQGLAISAEIQGESDVHFWVTYQWWEETKDGAKERHIKLPLDPNKYSQLNVSVHKFRSKFSLNVEGKKISADINKIIDYQYALKWVGCGNNLGFGKEDYDESYASIYLGDISKLHIENKLLTKPTLDLLFHNYEEFKQNYLYGNTSEYIIFSSDFSEYTSYKVKDYSSNKSNLIKYDPMWFSD